jgi:hypothetical protein
LIERNSYPMRQWHTEHMQKQLSSMSLVYQLMPLYIKGDYTRNMVGAYQTSVKV